MNNPIYNRRGKKAEQDFVICFKSAYPNVSIVSGTTEEDKQHIDFKIRHREERTFDVKSIKSHQINRCDENGKLLTNYTIVELINDKFYQGWVFSDRTDFIAFQSGTSENFIFLCVDREQLRTYVKKNVMMKTVESLPDAVNKLYSRGNDIMTVVDMEFLRYLPNSFIVRKKYF